MADVWQVNFPACRLFFCLLVALSGVSCQRYITENSRFWTVISTDYEGEVIAEWTSVGRPWKIPGGVRILAIQKKVPGPYPLDVRYVIGRRVTVQAPHVTFFRTEAPDWMRDASLVTTSETVVSSYAK